MLYNLAVNRSSSNSSSSNSAASRLASAHALATAEAAPVAGAGKTAVVQSMKAGDMRKSISQIKLSAKKMDEKAENEEAEFEKCRTEARMHLKRNDRSAASNTLELAATHQINAEKYRRLAVDLRKQASTAEYRFTASKSVDELHNLSRSMDAVLANMTPENAADRLNQLEALNNDFGAVTDIAERGINRVASQQSSTARAADLLAELSGATPLPPAHALAVDGPPLLLPNVPSELPLLPSIDSPPAADDIDAELERRFAALKGTNVSAKTAEKSVN